MFARQPAQEKDQIESISTRPDSTHHLYINRLSISDFRRYHTTGPVLESRPPRDCRESLLAHMFADAPPARSSPISLTTYALHRFAARYPHNTYPLPPSYEYQLHDPLYKKAVLIPL